MESTTGDRVCEPVVPVDLAIDRSDRRRGLLGRDGYDGIMVFPRTRQVHTFGMRFTIDVAWCARSGVVVRTARIAPNRLSAWVRQAHAVLEAEAGTFAHLGIVTGDRIACRSADEDRRPWLVKCVATTR